MLTVVIIATPGPAEWGVASLNILFFFGVLLILLILIDFQSLLIFKETTPHSAGPGVAIIITVSKEELRTWEGGF